MKKVALLFFLTFSLAQGSGLDDANFTYKGQPIHPRLVQQFEGWLSDSGKPIITSADVAAAFDTNQYSNADIIRDGNWIRINGKEGAYFKYQWLGKVNGNRHVLKICSSGGGSGIFESLYFCKFYQETGILDNVKYSRLLLKIEQVQTLGDHDDAKITVENNRVIIGKSKYRDTDLILKAAP